MDVNKIYAEALNTFGEQNQLCVVSEECAELIQAVSKWIRYSKIADDSTKHELKLNMITEIADVYIMIEQLLKITDISFNDVMKERLRKLNRLETKIEEAHNA